jgi:hypothetical protein
MARDKPVIWVKWKERYFCKQGWTRRLPNSLSGKSDIEENEAENASWKKAPARDERDGRDGRDPGVPYPNFARAGRWKMTSLRVISSARSPML